MTSKLRGAALWAFVGGAFQQAGQIVVSVALAWILGPERWGIVALATVYVLFVEFLVRQGMIQAIIQRDELEDEHLDSAFAMLVGVGAGLGVVTVAISGWWAALNDAPDLQGLMIALSGLAVFQGAWQVPMALIQREFDFKRATTVLNAAVFTGAIAGLVAAALGAGVWSIVVQLYTHAALATFASYRAHPWRPRLRWSGVHARQLLGFSLGSFLASLGAFVSQKADTFLLGVIFGPVPVGLYQFGARFAQVITDITAGSLGRVGLAALSRFQGDRDAFGRETLRFLGSITLIVLPALGVLAAVGRGLPLLVGEEWRASGPVLRVLCLAAVARGLVMFTNPILQARGVVFRAAGALWFAGAVHVVALVAAAVVLRDEAVADQVLGLAAARLAAQVLVVTPGMLVLVSRAIAVPVRRLVGAQLPALSATLAAFVLGIAVDQIVRDTGLPLLIALGVVGAVASAAGAVVLYGTSSVVRDVVRTRSLQLGEPVASGAAS